jgi:hypothetical protein
MVAGVRLLEKRGIIAELPAEKTITNKRIVGSGKPVIDPS